MSILKPLNVDYNTDGCNICHNILNNESLDDSFKIPLNDNIFDTKNNIILTGGSKNNKYPKITDDTFYDKINTIYKKVVLYAIRIKYSYFISITKNFPIIIFIITFVIY